MDALKGAFKKHGMDVICVSNKEEALNLAKSFIKPGMSIGLGGSTTVAQIGLLDYVCSLKDITLFNQYEKGISMEENTKRRREGMLSDLYICGTNALTKTGELVNADGSGNRVAAQIFGPHKVLIVVGKNKIVENCLPLNKKGNININIKRCSTFNTIEIIDDAGAIDEKVINSIFDPYFTTKQDGMGLGLYMAKVIIEEKMRGSITVRNDENHVIFTIKLPHKKV